MPEVSTTDSPVPGPIGRTLDDYLADRLPNLSKRERRRMVARGGVTINGREATDIAEPLGSSDVVELPPPPGGTRWAEKPTSKRAAPETEEHAVPSTPPLHQPPRADEQPGPEAGPQRRHETGSERREQKPWDPERSGPLPDRKRFLARGVRLMYEDDDVIVVDKSPGIVTADPTQQTPGTVFEVIKRYMRMGGAGRVRVGGRGRGRTGRVWVVHRLDKEVSGVVVFAKSEKGFESLKEQFRSKRTHRVYAALVEGVVGPAGHAGTHQSFLVEGEGMKMKSIAASEFRGTPGKEARLAVTHFRVIASDPRALAGTGASLLQVRLDTGRKNQIRAHMADLGHPIVGDRRYGAVSDPLGRVALHASELGFTHPATGQAVRFSSPAPGPFSRAVGLKPSREEGEAEPPAPVMPVRAAPPPSRHTDTSWDRVADWYDDLISERKNDHYEQVILPGALRLIEPRQGMKLLDVACGQGVLSRRLSSLGVKVTGVDASPQLIAAARSRGEGVEYHVGDAKEIDKLGLGGLDAAACIMALGNIDPLDPVFRGVAGALRDGGTFTFVVAHPAFRAPGQTMWGWDDRERRQYRRVDGYLSPGQKAIQMHPGKDTSIVTWTFHRPLQAYSRVMADAGFVIDRIEEWPGKRVSTSGPRAAEENRIRREIPLFLAVRGVKRGVEKEPGG